MFVYYPRRLKALNFENFDNSHKSFLWPEYFIDFLCERWIPFQASASVLCLHYRPETVHCSTKDVYTSEITFLAFTILAPNMILNFIGLFRFRVFTFPVDGLDLSRMNSLSFLRSTTVSPSGFCCIWIYTTTFTTEIKNCALYFLRVYCLSRANIIFVFVYNIYSWIC